MVRHLVNIVLWFLPPSRLFALRRFLLRLADVRVGAGVSVCGRGWIYGRGQVRFGDGTWLSPGVVIFSHLDAPVVVGSRCDIGPGVMFITGSHEAGTAQRRAGAGTARAISVGDGCWIGAGTQILGGVVVGDGAVIAAGAVVTRDVSPHTLVAGVPAVPKRRLS